MDNLQYSWGVDMWSIGIVIFEMLTGDLPFTGSTEIEYLLNVFRRKGTPSQGDLKRVFMKNSKYLRMHLGILPRDSKPVGFCRTELDDSENEQHGVSEDDEKLEVEECKVEEGRKRKCVNKPGT